MKFARFSLLIAILLFSKCPLAFAQEPAKAPPPLQVIVFDSTGSYEDDLPKAVVQTRNSLRNDKRLEVFLFDPGSPTFTLAASSATPPISLTSVQTSAQQSAIATAFGADYYVVLAPDGGGKKVTTTICSVQSGSTQTISKAESPNSAASDIASLIESGPSSSAETPSQAASKPPSPASTSPVPSSAPTQPDIDAPVVPVPVQSAPPIAAVSAPTSPKSPVGPTAPLAALPAQQSTLPMTRQPVPVAASPSTPIAAPVLSTDDSVLAVAPTLDLGESAASSSSSVPTPPATTQNSPGNSTSDQAASTPAPTQASPPAQSAPIPTIVVAPPPATQTVIQSPPSVQPAPVSESVTLPPISQTSTPSVEASNSLGTSSGSADTNSSPTIQITAVTVGGTTAPVPSQPNDSSSSGAPLGTTISRAAQTLIDQGDAAVQTSDDLTAISLYQKAISLAPRSAAPRLKLAEAYVDAGMKDAATEEARRALAIDPGNADVQNFIKGQDSGVDGPTGDVIIAQAQTESDPNNPAAWINLGDAYWNVGDPDDSLISYKRAADINPTAVLPQTRLAKLYAARAQYDESLAALRRSGSEGYPYALRIIASRSESLVGDIDDETQSFLKGTDTREVFYGKIKVTDMQAAGLADFVSKITAPTQYNISQLHRQLSTSLLAQTAAVWADYAETNNDSDKDQAAALEKDAIEEMKTASIAEDLLARIKP